MSSTAGVHHAAARGFAANADGYARGRPDYPAPLAGWLRDAVGLASGKRVADIGAGTGKFLPLLLATGASVTAVEPVDAMRARLSAAFPEVDARSGAADALPLADASLDAIVCAQAFHWFATPSTMREFARVLRPGGVLALIWNVRDEAVPWVRRLTDLMSPHEGTAPRAASGAWRRVFPSPGFGPLEETIFAHVHVGTPDHVIVDRVMSVSFIAALPEAERTTVEAALNRLIAGEPDLAAGGDIAFPYRTHAFRTTRL